MVQAEAIPGTVVHDKIVSAGVPWGGLVTKEQILRIIVLEGNRGVDFLCYDADHPKERKPGLRAWTVRLRAHSVSKLFGFADLA